MENIKKTAFIRENNKIVEYVGTKMINTDLDVSMYSCKMRYHNDYMTLQFLDEATKNIIEHDADYDTHDEILAKLFTDGFVQIPHRDGTRVVVKRNYCGSVRKSTGWTVCSANALEKAQWSIDDRSDYLLAEAKNTDPKQLKSGL